MLIFLFFVKQFPVLFGYFSPAFRYNLFAIVTCFISVIAG